MAPRSILIKAVRTKSLRRWTPLLFLCFLGYQAKCQRIPKILVDEYVSGKRMRDVFDDLNRGFGLYIFAEDVSVHDRIISDIDRKYTLESFLITQLPDKKAQLVGKNIILIADKESSLGGSVDKYILVNDNAENIAYRVFDYDTGIPMVGANVWNVDSQIGSISDSLGIGNIGVVSGFNYIDVSYVGYDPMRFAIISSPHGKKGNQTIDAPLQRSANMVEVQISGQKSNNNISQQADIQKLNIAAIKSLPTFMGESDPIKGLSTLPGVSNNGDVSIGFNVRGSKSSQNLILQDGTTIYNPNHLFGLFSLFNPDFISGVTLHKGGGDASLGGRVASILEINNRSGSLTDYKASGSVGLTTARLALEGPIVKDKTSVLLGGRLFYGTWMLQHLKNKELNDSNAHFHDLSFKILHSINDKNYVSGFAYYSHDDFTFTAEDIYTWKTSNLGISWDHQHSDTKNSQLTWASSNYRSNNINTDLLTGVDRKNAIQKQSLHYDISDANSSWTWSSGAAADGYIVTPFLAEPNNPSSIVQKLEGDRQHALLLALYGTGQLQLGQKLSVQAGMRYSHFWRLGPGTHHELSKEQLDGRYPAIIGQEEYKSGEVLFSSGGIEPRLGITLSLSDRSSIKTGYKRTRQYLHHMTASITPSPLDYYALASPNLRPQIGDQVSLGLYTNFLDNDIETYVEGYTKKITNTIDYIDGANLQLNPLYEAQVLQGAGISYGVEFFVKKKKGKLNGWLSYTYLKSLLKFDNENISINDGKYYSSVFDLTHQISLVSNLKLSKAVTFSTSFTYYTGQPITVPISKYQYADYLAVKSYSNRNGYRLPDYHRLDASIRILPPKHPDRRYSSEWVVSIYNLYGRKNIYSLFFNDAGIAYRTTILGAVVPSVSYYFKY